MTDMSTKFSVIMPAYNSAAFIREAVESVLNQTYKNWELLIVNDGSTDETLSILEEYAASDKRINVFSKPNGGYVSAVNYGMERVKGDYFLFMGSDDKLDVGLFSAITDSVGDKSPDMIAFKTLKVFEDDTTKPDCSTDYDTYQELYDCDITEYQRLFPKHSEIFYIRDTSRIYKTAVLGDLRYFGKYGIDADGIFSVLFAHKSRSFASVPFIGYYWSVRKTSLSGKEYSADIAIDALNNWWNFFKQIEDIDESDISIHEKDYIERYRFFIRLLALKNPGYIRKNRKWYKDNTRFALKMLKQYKLKYSVLKRCFLRFPFLYLVYARFYRAFK